MLSRLPILGHAHYFILYGVSDAIKALEDLYCKYQKNDIVVIHIGPADKIAVIGDKKDLKNNMYVQIFVLRMPQASAGDVQPWWDDK